MRKNAPRKWIHAILDLLPLLVIPIFAININQKEVEPITITQNQYKIVDFNQLFNDGLDYEIPSARDIKSDGVVNFDINHVYQLRFTVENLTATNNYILIGFWNSTNTLYKRVSYSFTQDGTYNIRMYSSNWEGSLTDGTNTHLIFQCQGTYSSSSPTIYSDIQVFDLTQIYGSGNEPIIATFNKLFNEDYYDFTTSTFLQIPTSITVIYNETDIGSQFLYSIYKPVNDYFNFNNLFNMNDVWNWIQLNLFSGSAPLPVFIVWNIILYEFFIDLIFLLYSVFMFIIDFATNCLERPFNKVR